MADEQYNPLAAPDHEWRVRPEPREPRRIWLTQYGNGDVVMTAWDTEAEAMSDRDAVSAVEFVEVIRAEKP